MTTVQTSGVAGMSQAQADAAYETLAQVQTASPLTGANVQITDDNKDRTLWLTPAGTLASLTINLPTEANSRIGQIVRISSNKAITTVSMAGVTTIINPIVTLSIGDVGSYQKVAANTWIRVS